ncbi:carbohydrate ABC transporter permease [Streptomyces sp. C10-9-1]|uniref:carbohydrate ABC transporter permease n=1 Tax=Streptomyces sp. C10-9-1 TaxID=1859285 RepID=UPI003D74D699
MPVQTEAPPVTARTAQPPDRPPERWSRYRSRTLYAFVAPWLIGFLALTAVPMLYALRMSFTNTNGMSEKADWVGFGNYIEALKDADVLHSLYRTGVFTLTVVPLTVIGSVLLALLVNQPIRGESCFRMVFYLPAIVPGVGAALTWKLIFDRDAGPANGILGMLNIDPVTWLQDPAVSYVLLSLMLWSVGGGMLVSLAGLQDIPGELLEAARVDGAGRLRVFWHVTVPLLSPILLFQVVTGVINAMQVIAQPLLLAPTPGGVVSAAQVTPDNNLYMVHVYAQYFTFGRWGYGSALLWLLFIVVLVITFLVMKLGKSVVFYNVDPDGQGEKG